MYGRATLLALLVVLSVAATGFAVDADAGRPEPAEFRHTVVMGATAAIETQVEFTNRTIPRAQVFYSQYRYAVGFYGVRDAVDELNREGVERQFGRPVAIYVSDYAGADPWMTSAGYLAVERDRTAAWVPADEAHYVVDSDVRTPAGPAVVPFSDRAAARSFAAEHGGRVADWRTVSAMDFGTAAASRERHRAAVRERTAWADGAVAATGPLLDRPVSVVVGEDAPSLAAAVERAPANTTVVLPAGTYRVGTVTVEKPLTIRGAGNATTLVGDRNGSVLRGFAARIAVADLSIVGVDGNFTPSADVDDEEWDAAVQQGYGFGPAGVEFEGANGSLVHDVTVHTPANGVVVRWSDGVVVDGARVDGSEEWWEGFMGVMVMESRVVVQESTVVGGRDGVYTHRAHGSVVRNCTMRALRFGVHEMYTSRTLLADNEARDADIGLVVMTRPAGNALVGNDVRASGTGIRVSGSDSYVADNVVADNGHGLDVVARRSLWERNVVVGNDVGISAETLLPTNTVVANDVVGNDRQALATLGPLRVWGREDHGNYWGGAPGFDRDGDGTLDRPYRATGAVDGVAHRAPGADRLALSPAVALRRSLSAVAPGLRETGVVDYHPRVAPVQPTVVDAVRAGTNGSQGENVTAAGAPSANEPEVAP